MSYSQSPPASLHASLLIMQATEQQIRNSIQANDGQLCAQILNDTYDGLPCKIIMADGTVFKLGNYDEAKKILSEQFGWEP
jgi:hypothetical protein